LIKNCTTVITDDGTEKTIDEEVLNNLKEIQNDWCLLGQRVLIICKKKEKIENVRFEKSSELETYLKGLRDLCIVGLVGIIGIIYTIIYKGSYFLYFLVATILNNCF
jgi:hypothetical protein